MEEKQYNIIALNTTYSHALAVLEQQCFSTPWSQAQFEQAFEQKVFKVYGCVQAATLIAYVAVYQMADELEILNIAVHNSFRRHGIGHLLLAHLLHNACAEKINNIFLEVRVSNTPAIALYESFSFLRVGRRPRYYQDTGEDALVYALDLDCAP